MLSIKFENKHIKSISDYIIIDKKIYYNELEPIYCWRKMKKDWNWMNVFKMKTMRFIALVRWTREKCDVDLDFQIGSVQTPKFTQMIHKVRRSNPNSDHQAVTNLMPIPYRIFWTIFLHVSVNKIVLRWSLSIVPYRGAKMILRFCPHNSDHWSLTFVGRAHIYNQSNVSARRLAVL